MLTATFVYLSVSIEVHSYAKACSRKETNLACEFAGYAHSNPYDAVLQELYSSTVSFSTVIIPIPIAAISNSVSTQNRRETGLAGSTSDL
eukprot:IDg21994t1